MKSRKEEEDESDDDDDDDDENWRQARVVYAKVWNFARFLLLEFFQFALRFCFVFINKVHENENIVAFYLSQLAKKNNINFNILPRFRKNLNIITKEKLYYNKILKNNFKFILNKKKSSYDILQNYKFIFSTYSTLAIECLAKGSRAGFIMIKSKKNPVYNFRFGSFENLRQKGLFWTTLSQVNVAEINRVFNFVIKTNYDLWIKKTKYYKKKTMNFDYENKTFRKIIKKF